MKLFFSVLFCLSFTFGYAQNDFEKKLDSISLIDSTSVRIQLLENFKASFEEGNTKEYGTLCYRLGAEYYYEDNYSKALENVETAVSIRDSIKSVAIVDVYKSIYLRSLCYGYFDETKKELKDLHRLANSVNYTKYKIRAYLRLAEIYNQFGDYFKSMEYSDKLINSYSIHNNEKKLIDAHLERLITYAQMSSSNTAFIADIEYHEQELEKRIASFYPEDKALYYNNLGVIYRAYKNYEKALALYQKALKNTIDEGDDSSVNDIYLNIGEMYSQLKQPEKAEEYYNKILETTDSINTSGAYNNLGYYHATSIEQEIEYHQKAIQLLEINEKLLGTISFIEKIKSSPYKAKLLSILIDLSQAWIKLYHQNKNDEHLQEALKTVYAIDELISVMRLDSDAKSSKLFWIKRGVNSYLEAMKICYLLDKPKEAFYFMEKNKSLYLLEKLEEIQARAQYEIPEKLLNKEASLGYEKFLANNKLKKKPENKLFQDAFDKASRKHFKFTDSLKNIFPEYYESNLKPQLISLNEFQDFLKENNTQAIEYIFGEKEGYGLWIRGDNTQFFKLEEYSKLLVNIHFLKKKMKPSLSKEEVSQYQKIGFEVFNSLFPSQKNVEQLKENRLSIIPDGVLYNFNFETLIVDKKPTLKDNFLINITEVSYLNSASVSQNLYGQKTVNSYSYLGIAPVEFNSETLIDLKNSEKITKEVASLFSSDLQLKGKATKSAFLKPSKEHAILHINTHAGIDYKTKSPWLALHDTLISLEEVYALNRSYDLVFLDACKTGDGKLQKGEGIESLSRAFFHSGTKSVIASQWNANEKATNAISLSFFKELKKGSTKSSALRKAKLTYLRNNELSNSLPYFWGSLTLTGNSDALPEVSHNLYYWIIIVGILFIVVALYNKRRRHKSKL